MRKHKEKIELTKEHKEKACQDIRDYMDKEFDVDIGNLQSQMFLDFITEKIGICYYNVAISDAMKHMGEKVDEMFFIMKNEENK